MRVLITGITGFIGGHLSQALSDVGGHEIVGTSRETRSTDVRGLGFDDESEVRTVIEEIRPDWLFHLAGFASPRKSIEDPEGCWQANFTATQHLYNAIAKSDVRPRLLLASTGLVYGDPSISTESFDEHSELKPASPYAASKAAADLLSYQMSCNPGLDIMSIRLFNQIGPGQSKDYAIANFARQIAAIEAGQQEPLLETYSLDGQRDITDVRDIVSAFVLLMKHGKSGEVYNAGRGTTWRIGDLLDKLMSLSHIPIEVRTKAEGRTVMETAITRANSSKLKQATGWQPQYNIDQTLSDILNDWRNRAT